MLIPKLEINLRETEYSKYSSYLRAKVIYGYLFEGHSHRTLDTIYLNHDGNKSRGWQAMGILHFLGLTLKHKNIFSKLTLEGALNVMKNDQS